MFKLLRGFRAAIFRLPKSEYRYASGFPRKHRLGSRLSPIKSRRSENQKSNRPKTEAPHQYTSFEQPQLGPHKPESKLQPVPWPTAIAVLMILLSSCYTGYYRAKSGDGRNDDPFLLYLDRSEWYPIAEWATAHEEAGLDGKGDLHKASTGSNALATAHSLLLSVAKHPDGINYQQLETKGEIRVLVIKPGTDSKKIVCELQHINIIIPEKGMTFEAVSYVWGPQDQTRMITVGANENVEIGLNLHEALVALRLPDEERILWVDKLCINQKDIIERTQQVKVMGIIYHTAQRVLIWIGSNENGEDGSLKLVSEMIQRLRGDTSSAHLLNWQPVVQILRREWFQRMWMVQELAQAREAIVIFGKETANWDDLFQPLASSIRSFDYHALPESIVKSISYLLILDGIRTKFITHDILRDRYPLSELMSLTRHFKATDPRDKIFALVGLAGDVKTSDWEVSPDYSTSPAELYRRFACWQITRQKNLEAFSLSTHNSPGYTEAPPPAFQSWFTKQPPAAELIPSWAPDLSNPDQSAVLPKLYPPDPLVVVFMYDNYKDLKRAAKYLWERTQSFHADFAPVLGFSTRTRCLPPAVAFSDGNNVLHIRGLRVSVILWTSMTSSESPAYAQRQGKEAKENPIDDSSSAVDWMIDRAKWLFECYNKSSSWDRGNKTADQKFDAFWRTMICDMTPDLKIAPPSFSQSFSQILDILSKPIHTTHDVTGTSNGFRQACTEIVPSLCHWSQGRRMALGTGDKLASVPKAAKPGDLICIFVGGRVPIVVRPRADGYFELVGECYLHGAMHGVLDGLKIHKYRMRSFALK